MKKNSIWMGIALLATAATSFACDSDVGQGNLDTNLVFSCINPSNCNVVMNPNSTATVMMKLGDADGTAANNMDVNVVSSSALVEILNAPSFKTQDSGIFSFVVKSGAESGSSVLTTKLSSDTYSAPDGKINVLVNASGATLSCVSPSNCLIAMAPNSQATLSVMATSAEGVLMSDTALSFTPATSLITVDNTQTNTNVAGIASVNLKSGASEGTTSVAVAIAGGQASNVLNVSVLVTGDSKDKVMNLECVDLEGCSVVMAPNTTYDLTIHAKNGNNANIASTNLTFSQSPELVALSDSILKTNAEGKATLKLTSSDKEGTSSLVVSSPDAAYMTTPLPVNIRVAKPLPNYTIDFAYSGEKEVTGVRSLAFANGKCDNIIAHDITVDGLSKITGEDISKELSLDETFEFQAEKHSDTYAVVALGKNAAGSYVALGCDDTLSEAKTSATITLEDARPDTYSYVGKYDLVSSFDMVSILSKYDCGTPDCAPTFQQMKAGDWVQFILNFFSNPEKAVVDMTVNQLVPLIFENEKLLSLLTSVLGEQLGGMLNSEIIKVLIETVRPTIESTLANLTDQISWWDDLTAISTIVNKFVSDFTLAGQLEITTEPKASGFTAQNHHRYTDFLYSLEKYPCPGEQLDGRCLQPLGKEAITGTWEGNIAECSNANATCIDISNHPLSIAYASVLYEFVTETVFPLVFKDKSITSFGTLLENLAIQAIVNNYNEKNPETAITSTGCAGFGDWVSLALADKKLFGMEIGKLIANMGGSSIISSACKLGISKVDDLIVNLLSKLTASADKINFAATQCNLTLNDSQRICSNIGTPQAKCTWNISVDGNNNVKLNGSFYSTRVLQ